jgi:hypothetical protein
MSGSITEIQDKLCLSLNFEKRFNTLPFILSKYNKLLRQIISSTEVIRNILKLEKMK